MTKKEREWYRMLYSHAIHKSIKCSCHQIKLITLQKVVWTRLLILQKITISTFLLVLLISWIVKLMNSIFGKVHIWVRKTKNLEDKNLYFILNNEICRHEQALELSTPKSLSAPTGSKLGFWFSKSCISLKA